MLVVEDRETNELKQLLLVDASVKLGIIQLGASIRSFDPERLLRFYDLVGSQVYDLASQYATSFRYLPRRAYSYLSRPPLLADIYDSNPSSVDGSWIADMFVAHPLTEVSNKALPRFQQRNNIDSCFRWGAKSEFSSRIYALRNLGHGLKIPAGWGCLLDASSLSNVFEGKDKDALIQCIKNREPIYLHLNEMRAIDEILEWLVFVKEAALPQPEVVFLVPSHKHLEEHILALLELPRTRLLTSGATIGSLSTIINVLKKTDTDMHWSEKLIFSSAYPETQLGDTVPEILSFILSKNMGATLEDLQRILAGNILSLLPVRPSFLGYRFNENTALAEGKLGKTALLEISRLLRVLSVRKIQDIISFDFMLDSNNGLVDFDSGILTVEDIKTGLANSVALHREQGGSLRLVAWNPVFSESVTPRNAKAFRTSIVAADKGPVLDAPSHISAFNNTFLNALGVSATKEVMSSLQFGIENDEIDPGKISMCSGDMKAIGVKSGNTVTILDANSGHWWGASVNPSKTCPSRNLGLSANDSKCYGLTQSSKLDVIRYVDKVADLTSVLLTYEDVPGFTESELSTHLHIERDEIIKRISSHLIGIGSRFVTSKGVELDVAYTEPAIERNQLARIGDTLVEIQPRVFLNDLNILLILSTGSEMKTRDVQLATPTSLKKYLEPFAEGNIDLQQYLKGLGTTVSRGDVSTIIGLLTLMRMKRNRSDGKMGIIFAGSSPMKFSIQKGATSQDYIELYDDMNNNEVITSLIYSILDSGELPEGPTNPTGIFRSIAEMLEDFGGDRPTIVIICASNLEGQEAEIDSYTKAISGSVNYHLELIGIGNGFETTRAQSILKGLKVRILPLNELSMFDYLGYLQSVIKQISPR
ncbi:MAG: hypothetical protein ACFFEF_05900 [Candidatus Thorarchaeota archaeon]